MTGKIQKIVNLFFVKMSLLGECQAKPEDVETEIWSVVETDRQTAVTRIAVPATTTGHTDRPTIRTSRIRLRGTRIRTIPIRTPFPYVTSHIINP